MTALFVDRGSWQVWAEPPDEEDPHDTLHVVAEFSEPHLAARVRWHLVDGIPQWCRVVDVAVLTDSTDWEIVHGTLVFNGPHDGPCYVIPSLARALDT